jgi:hypothetical protein
MASDADYTTDASYRLALLEKCHRDYAPWWRQLWRWLGSFVQVRRQS